MLGIKGVPFLNISHHNCNAVQSSNYCSLESYGAAVVKLICIIRGNKWKSLILPQMLWQKMKWSTREERQWVLCYTDRVCRTRDVVIMMILTLCPGWAGAGAWWRPRSRLIGKFYKWGKWLAACEPGHSGHSVHTDTRARLLTLPLRQVLGLLFAVSYLVSRVTLIYCICIIITCTFHFHSDCYSGYWLLMLIEVNTDDPCLYIIHYTLYIRNPSMTITRGQGKVLCHILNTK